MADNIEKYEKIWKHSKTHPDVSVAQLCREHDVSYQAYNNWKKRAKSDVSSQSQNVTINISLEDLAQHYLNKTEYIKISVVEAVNSLTPQQKHALATQVGLAQMEKDMAKAADRKPEKVQV